MRKLSLVLVAAVLVAPALAFSAEAENVPNPIRASPAFDADGNRIFDDLDLALGMAPPEARVPVIVLFTGATLAEGLRAVRAEIGEVDVAFEYPTLPGAALTLARDDVLRLAALDVVRQVEPDRDGERELATSTTYIGARATWTDLGVTGDADGNPAVFSKDDATIAVLDTGVHAAHLDFSGGKLIGWHDTVGGSATPFDNDGHGTHVSSIATGRGVADGEMKGVAPDASLVVVRISAKSHALAAVQWVIANKDVYGIDVMTMSFGFGRGADGSDSLAQLFDQAFAAGIVTVKSTGNSGSEHGTMTIPADARKILAVGALEDPGKGGWKLATFSSRGPTTDGRVKPDVSAPGVDIGAAARGTTNGYVALSGTSMAAPHVAGVAALVKSANPALTAQEIRDLIVDTAHDRGFPGADNDYGAGVVDPYAAVSRALGGSGTNPVTAPGVLTLTDAFPAPNAWLVEIAGGPHLLSINAVTDAPPGDRAFQVTVDRVAPTPFLAGSIVNTGARHATLEATATPGTYLVTVTGSAQGGFALDVSADVPAEPPAWHGLHVPGDLGA